MNLKKLRIWEIRKESSDKIFTFFLINIERSMNDNNLEGILILIKSKSSLSCSGALFLKISYKVIPDF